MLWMESLRVRHCSLIRPDEPTAQGNTRAAAGRTLVRRYALALIPAGTGNKAAVTATSVPPLSGGPGTHGSEATHALTITGNASTVTWAGAVPQARQSELRPVTARDPQRDKRSDQRNGQLPCPAIPRHARHSHRRRRNRRTRRRPSGQDHGIPTALQGSGEDVIRTAWLSFRMSLVQLLVICW